KLGDTVTIKGGLADGAEATAENLRVDVNEKNELVIKMSKDLKGLENIVVGSDGKDGKPGVSINGEDGSIGLTGPAGQDGKDAPHLDISVKDGKPGLDGKDGEVRIVYKDKEGNEKEVASLDDGLQFGADNEDVVVNRKLNTKLDIKGGAEAASADRNIVTTANADGSIQLDLAKDLKLADNEGNAGSITLGKPGADGKDSAKLDGSGLTLTGKDGKPGPSITQDGINAGDKVIAGVKDGEKPTDAV
ncbi:hypothetical protein DC080_10290, partial [Ignatzschineria cameli]